MQLLLEEPSRATAAVGDVPSRGALPQLGLALGGRPRRGTVLQLGHSLGEETVSLAHPGHEHGVFLAELLQLVPSRGVRPVARRAIGQGEARAIFEPLGRRMRRSGWPVRAVGGAWVLCDRHLG